MQQSTSMGYQLSKPHLSGDPRHLWVIIAHQHCLRQASLAHLHFHIIHQRFTIALLETFID
jgi:hypothetical protein